jgi:hypothetical protein
MEMFCTKIYIVVQVELQSIVGSTIPSFGEDPQARIVSQAIFLSYLNVIRVAQTIDCSVGVGVRGPQYGSVCPPLAQLQYCVDGWSHTREQV